MYIDPFWAGVATGWAAGWAFLIGLVWISSARQRNKNRRP